MGIMENLRFMVRFRIQFRGQMSNAFNTANLVNSSTRLTSSTFGEMNPASVGRILQLGLKLYF